MQGTTANKLIFLDLEKSSNYIALDFLESYFIVDLQRKIDEVCILTF